MFEKLKKIYTYNIFEQYVYACNLNLVTFSIPATSLMSVYFRYSHYLFPSVSLKKGDIFTNEENKMISNEVQKSFNILLML